jgi:hypothetical protein
MPMMAVSGKFRLLNARFCTGASRRCRVAEGGLHLSGEVSSLTSSRYTLLQICSIF